MNAFVNRYATPLTSGLFAVSAISGVALFFHWAPRTFHGMHEWLSILLLVPFALHMWKNWRGLAGYLRHRTLIVPLVASLVIAAPFAYSGIGGGEGGGGNPAVRTVRLLTQAPLSDLAPVLKTTPEALLASLREKGHTAASADHTLATIAATSGVQPNDLLFALLPPRR